MDKKENERTEIENELVSQLYEELGFKVGIKDNLLEIGLNSLNVMKMMSE